MSWMHFWYEVGLFFGISNEAGPGYAFWSGVGSDLGEFALLGGLVAVYRQHSCHVDRCWRLARHKHLQDGTEIVLCRKHHPGVASKDFRDTDIT